MVHLPFDNKSILFMAFFLVSLVLVIVPLEVNVGFAIRLVLILIALLLDIAAFSTRYYTYFMMKLFKMKGRTVVLNSDDPFILAPSGNAIISRDGSVVYASAFVNIPVYRSATEMTNEEKVEFSSLFGRIASISKTPVKISSQLYVINKDEYINKITMKLNQAEEKYTASENDKTTPRNMAERIRGEVTMWRNLLDNVNRSQSKALLAYAMVTGSGGTEEEAVNIAVQDAEEIASGISAILGISTDLVSGTELLTPIEPDYMIPTATISERIRQKTMEEGM